MAQLQVTVTEETMELIGLLCDDSGESKSGLAARLLVEGVVNEIERANKKRVFRNLLQKDRTKSSAE